MERPISHSIDAGKPVSSGDGEEPQRFVDPNLGQYEPALLDRARKLIGPKLRPLIAPSDLLQETLLIAVRRVAEVSGRPSRQVLAWLLQTMRFRLMRYVRDHRTELDTQAEPTVEPVGDSTSVTSRLIQAELIETMLSRFELLPEADRKLLLWIYVERLDTAEIAARLGRTESAVRGLHHRAIGRLRGLFEAERP
ncbi:RNA polymerase sigma factor [Tundrisphaera lichenicola]|uniref:RNA polymerase sigma factor n=1 Tax=Tundrisphaera lichenicola TaxID=2029860 RepID=UPI003EBD6AA9